MGDEWQASSPFLYFVDFVDDAALSNAVRKGRRNEFLRLKAFANAEAGAQIPDPTVMDTFARSRLDWSECRSPAHAHVYDECKELLSLRAKEIVPLLSKRFDGSSQEQRNDIIDVIWHFEGERLRLILNLSQQTTHVSAGDDARIIWQSKGVEADAKSITLPPWTGGILGSWKM